MSIRFGRGTTLPPSSSLFTIGSIFLLNRDYYGLANIREATNGLVIMILDNLTAADRRTLPPSTNRQSPPPLPTGKSGDSNAVPSKTVS